MHVRETEVENDLFTHDRRTGRAIPVDRGSQDSVGQRITRRLVIHGAQLAIIAAFLAAWQWLPSIGPLARSSHLFDRFFISSPEQVATHLYDLLARTGIYAEIPIYQYIWDTVSAALLGLLIGMVGGGLFGLALGSSRLFSDILRPFVVAMNATPRIALIPIVMVIFGPSLTGAVVVSIMVTFFIAFFNAYRGARTVAPPLIENAKLLGANRSAIMFHIRLPYVVAWTIAALPLAATFSFTSVIVAELLIGAPGLGRELGVATGNADATLTFELVVILTVVALITVGVSDLLTKRVLHWWGK